MQPTHGRSRTEAWAHDENAILAQQAADPNTPLATLLHLASRFPAAFCSNPVLPLLFLEDPGFPLALAPNDQGSLLRYAKVPAMLLRVLATHGPPLLAQAARLHVGLVGETPTDERHELQIVMAHSEGEQTDAHLVHDLAALDALPPWIARCVEVVPRNTASAFELAQFATPSPAVLRATDQATPLAALALLADDDDPWVRAAVAGNAATTASLLAQLKQREDAGDMHWAVYQQIAANSHTPAAVFVAFAADQTWTHSHIRRTVARNPSAPLAALELLANDIAADIRRIVISHQHVTPTLHECMVHEVLDLCLESAHPLERAIALSHPAVPVDAWLAGVDSPQWVERLAVVYRPAIPTDALASLCDDGNSLVRRAARQRFELHSEG